MIVQWFETSAGEFADLKEFRAVRPESKILAIDGEQFRGICGGCLQPVLGDARYLVFEDSGIRCERCAHGE